MKNLFTTATAITVAIVLWGCPYQSSVPLSTASEKVNKKVLGTWLPKHETGKANPEQYVIEMRDSLHYVIDHFQYNKNDSSYSVKEYLAWTTRVDNILFMNVQETGKPQHFIHRLDVMGDDLMILYQITSNIDEQFKKSDEMKKFFQKHMKLSFFYNRDEVELVRVRK